MTEVIDDEEDTDKHAADGGARAGTEEQLRRMCGWTLIYAGEEYINPRRRNLQLHVLYHLYLF